MKEFIRKYPVAAPLGLLTLCILLPYWKLATMQGVIITDDIFASDLMNDSFPARHYLGAMLQRGEFPLWYSSIYGGFPFIARAEAGACYPLNLLAFGILPPYAALNIVILTTFFIAAAGSYLFARKIGANVPGALAAGISFAYCGFMVAHTKHLSTVAAACWFPLGLYFIERAIQTYHELHASESFRSMLWFGLVFGLQLLSGHIQVAYYAGLFYGAYFVLRLFSTHWQLSIELKKKKGTVERRLSVKEALRHPALRYFVATAFLGIGLAAIQILPTYELVGVSQRSGGVSFDYAAQYAYDPANIASFVIPYVNGDIGNASYRGSSIFWEDFGYAGLVILILAVYGIIKEWKRWHVKCFIAFIIAAFLLVLGPNTPVFEAAFHILPGMSYFRFPTRFLFIVDASLAFLAAFGITAAVRRYGLRTGWILVALAAADLFYVQLRQNPVAPMNTWATPPATAWEILQDTSDYRIYSLGGKETHTAAFSAAHGWQGSLQPYIDQRELLQPSTNAIYGLASPDGYAQLTPSYVVDVWGDQNRGGIITQTAALGPQGIMPSQSFQKLMNVFNVKYIVSAWDIRSDTLRMMKQCKPAQLYENPGCRPRAFIAHHGRPASTLEEAKSIFFSPDFDPQYDVILHEQLPSAAPGTDSAAHVQIYSARSNSIALRTTTRTASYLILTDTYYPGWKAFVDGQETKIARANFCQRAILLPAGMHDVQFVFDSAPIKDGAVITSASLLLLIAGMFYHRFRRQR
ncbi:MAG: YfhO family protein [Ignavibacteriales bacterium]|nr:YfhO family protein [Ignavibacteriales bacterium]